MHLYVELWKARPAWLALSPAERTAYLDNVGPAIATLLEAGVELVGFALNDEATPHRADYTYLAAWRMPTIELIEALETEVEGAGWHEYFDQVNARGPLVSPADALEHMKKLG